MRIPKFSNSRGVQYKYQPIKQGQATNFDKIQKPLFKNTQKWKGNITMKNQERKYLNRSTKNSLEY
jgi:hypothetical protein